MPSSLGSVRAFGVVFRVLDGGVAVRPAPFLDALPAFFRPDAVPAFLPLPAEEDFDVSDEPGVRSSAVWEDFLAGLMAHNLPTR